MKGNLVLVAMMLAGTAVCGTLSTRKELPRTPVVTSANPGIFQSIQYDEDRRMLTLKFGNGYSYEYLAVPPERAYRLLHSPNKGVCFNEHIRGQYAFRRLPEFPR